jgi:cellulose synthase/poly-beta-1,6-N-acetylglucosamine synthase-like glycosyltransferase
MHAFETFASVAAILYLVAITLLAIYGLHSLWLLVLHRRHHAAATAQAEREDATPLPAELPHVLVQLPVFNERDVVVRLVDAIGLLEWPKDRLHIQLLDDSTDDSVEIGRAAMASLRAQGLDAVSLHRTDRTGFKAGALDAGLRANDAPFVAIFDADFVPGPDFLKKAIKPLLTDAGLGLVQGRWEHLNREATLLTRAQAMGIDGHFAIEQGARAWSGLAMNFNGTCGLWRREAIIDAGGWEHDTLTEDMDLSYRAQMRGWRCTYRVGLAVPGEIPDSVGAWRSQQFRWAKGSIQTAMKLLPRIWRTPVTPARSGGIRWDLETKLGATLHMTHYAIHPLMLLSLATAPLALCVLQHPPAWLMFAGVISFAIGAGTPILLYIVSQFVLHGQGAWRRLTCLPALCAIGTGVAVSNSIAVWQALRGQHSEFVRTPKQGAVGRARQAGSYRPNQASGVAELCCAAYAALGVGLAVIGSYPWVAPVLIIYFSGFGWMGVAIIRERWSSVPKEERGSAGPWLLPVGAGLVALSAVIGMLPADWHHHPRTFTVAGLAMGALWLVAVAAAWRHESGRRARAIDLVWILVVAVGMRIAVLGMAPGDDLDRAVVEGRAVAHGMNPYLVPPAEAVTQLTVAPAIAAGVAQATTTAIYPPLIQAYQGIVTAFSPTPHAFQWASLILELLGLTVVAGLLWRLGLPATRLAVAAWCPATVLWLTGEGHHDALVGLLMMGGLYLAVSGHRGRATAAIALAALAKPFALVVLPAVILGRPLRSALVAMLVLAVGSLFFIDAGSSLVHSLVRVGGDLQFHGALEPHLRMLFGLIVPDDLLTATVLGLLLAIWLAASWAIWTHHRERHGAQALDGASLVSLVTALYATLLLCLPALHPWYLTPLALLLPITRSWGLAVWLAAAPVYFLHALGSAPGTFNESPWVTAIAHVPAMAVLIVETANARRAGQPAIA